MIRDKFTKHIDELQNRDRLQNFGFSTGICCQLLTILSKQNVQVTGHNNYAKSSHLYLQDMLKLKVNWMSTNMSYLQQNATSQSDVPKSSGAEFGQI